MNKQETADRVEQIILDHLTTDGWITDPAIGLTRSEQLKACGNGVVTLQAVAALQDMVTR